MFELTKEELSRCKICTLNKGRGSNIKYLPFAFTELGVAMLSSVLKSNYAIKVNRDVMRVFVTLRKYASNYAELKHDIEHFKTETKEQFNDIYEVLDELISHKKELEKPSNPIGFVLKRG